MRNLFALAALLFALTGFAMVGAAYADNAGGCSMPSRIGTTDNGFTNITTDDSLHAGDVASPYPPYFRPEQ